LTHSLGFDPVGHGVDCLAIQNHPSIWLLIAIVPSSANPNEYGLCSGTKYRSSQNIFAENGYLLVGRINQHKLFSSSIMIHV